VGIVVGVSGVAAGVSVWGGSGPGPSGSTTVVGTGVVGDVGLVGDVGVTSVGLGSVVVVVVVVVGVVVVVLGRSWTLVRGTQVYSGSGTNPGGTTWAVSGVAGAGAGGW
jgi:hypothetical protein